MERPTLDEMYLRIAEVVSQRATCNRLKVGCVITNAERTTVWSIGYNGTARGLPNGCQTPDQPGNCGCDLHAEVNALIKAPYHEGDLVMYTTHTPCRGCAKAIINSQVKRVVCGQEYRSSEGVDLLRSVGMEVVIQGSPFVVFSAKDVQRMREETGAGMMQCKNALMLAYSFDDAINLLRVEGTPPGNKLWRERRAIRERTET